MCKGEFPRTPEFWHKQKKRTDGLSETCKACVKARSAKWYAENLEHTKAQRREYRARVADELRKGKKRYREENLEKVKERDRAYKAAHREELRLKQKQYQAKRSAIRAERRKEREAAYVAPTHRSCHVCKQEFPLTAEFWYKHKQQGLTETCKACVKARVTKWVAENREHRKRFLKQWSLKNADTIAEKKRQYRLANLETIRARDRAYQKAFPEVIKRITSRRRSREKSAPGSFTAEDLKEQYEVQNGECFYCRVKLDGLGQVDHYLPLSKGGTNYPSNIVLACDSCNLSKGNRLPSVFLRRLRRRGDISQ